MTGASKSWWTNCSRSDKQKLHAALAARRSAAGGLLAWAQRLLPAHFTAPPSALHIELAEIAGAVIHERGARVSVIAPRGSAKSTVIALAYPLLVSLEGAEPYTWIVSDTADQARQHLENVAEELASNELLAAAYPHVTLTRRSKARLALSNGCVLEALGIGQRVRGRRQRHQRPTLIVCDDVENDQHVQSPLQRERNWQWFNRALLKAGTPRTNVLVLGSALHRDCLTMRTTRTPGWESHVYRAILDYPARKDLWQQWETLFCDVERRDHRQAARAFYEMHRAEMDAGARVIWPEREPLYELMSMRVIEGRAAFESEKQGNPINPALCEWPEAYLTDVLFDEWPRQPLVSVLALDPSKGRDARLGDYQAWARVDVSRQGVVYADLWLNRESMDAMLARGVSLYEQVRPDAIGVEAVAFQELLGADLLALLRAAGALNPYVAPLTDRAPKVVRIRRLGPLLAQRRLRFRRGSPGAALCLDQMRDFPIGDHDDGPDALEMAVRLAAGLLAPGDESEDFLSP